MMKYAIPAGLVAVAYAGVLYLREDEEVSEAPSTEIGRHLKRVIKCSCERRLRRGTLTSLRRWSW